MFAIVPFDTGPYLDQLDLVRAMVDGSLRGDTNMVSDAIIESVFDYADRFPLEQRVDIARQLTEQLMGDWNDLYDTLQHTLKRNLPDEWVLVWIRPIHSGLMIMVNDHDYDRYI